MRMYRKYAILAASALFALVVLTYLAGGFDDPEPGEMPSRVVAEVDQIHVRDGRLSEQYCGPYFLGFPEATINLKLDVVMFRLKTVAVGGADVSFIMQATRDRIEVVIDDTKTVPLVTIDPPKRTEIRISRKDLDEAPCLKRSATPGSRI